MPHMAAVVSPPIPGTCLGAIPTPLMHLRDDVLEVKQVITFLQFGSQVLYSQRNQTNNAIGAASGETTGNIVASAIWCTARATPLPIFFYKTTELGRPPDSYKASARIPGSVGTTNVSRLRNRTFKTIGG